MGRETKARPSIKAFVARLGIVGSVLLASLSPLHTAFAIAEPDDLDIVDAHVHVFRHILETSDWLLLVDYNIDYASLPTEPATDSFILRVMNGSTQLGTNVPYAYNTKGYNEGLISIYLTAAQFTSQSMTWQAAYNVTISGNPGLFNVSSPTFPIETHTLTTTDYDTAASMTEARTNLGNYVIARGQEYHLVWTQITDELVSNPALGAALTSAGESYFTGAIPGLRNMAPQIFAVIATPAAFPTAVTGVSSLQACANPNTTNCDFPDELAHKYDGNQAVDDFLDGVGELLGGAGRAVVGMVVTFILCGVVLGISYVLHKRVKPGLLCVPLVIILGVLNFSFPMVFMAVLTLASVAVIGYGWFHRGAD